MGGFSFHWATQRLIAASSRTRHSVTDGGSSGFDARRSRWCAPCSEANTTAQWLRLSLARRRAAQQSKRTLMLIQTSMDGSLSLGRSDSAMPPARHGSSCPADKKMFELRPTRPRPSNHPQPGAKHEHAGIRCVDDAPTLGPPNWCSSHSGRGTTPAPHCSSHAVKSAVLFGVDGSTMSVTPFVGLRRSSTNINQSLPDDGNEAEGVAELASVGILPCRSDIPSRAARQTLNRCEPAATTPHRWWQPHLDRSTCRRLRCNCSRHR